MATECEDCARLSSLDDHPSMTSRAPPSSRRAAGRRRARSTSPAAPGPLPGRPPGPSRRRPTRRSQEQLRHGYWHYHLIPEAADVLRNRYVPLDELREILDDCGLAHRGTFAPIDATVQGDAYLDPRGPLRKEWHDGDSVWSLVAEDRLNRALFRIRALDERGELEAYVARNDAPRAHIGQVTVVFASRR